MTATSGSATQSSSADNWTSRNAWRCWIALIAFELGISVIIRFMRSDPGLGNWLSAHYPIVQIAVKVFRAGMWLIIAYWLSRASSVGDFMHSVGLRRRLSALGWVSAWLAAGLACLQIYGIARGWGSRSSVAHAFYEEGGLSYYSYMLYVISLGPFFEEVVLRGFLYTAFRRSHGPVLSLLFVLGVEVYFHWGVVIQSWWIAVWFLVLSSLLCVLRERTRNTWNCILCHAAYNAIGMGLWPLLLVGMITSAFTIRPQFLRHK
jgi:membrane protease YdiL (CAAX protease family)